MRAGQLRSFIEIYRQVEERTSSGAVSQVRKHICTLRCHLLKQNGYFKQTDYRETDKLSLVFETWQTDQVLDTDTLEWSNQEFKIVLIEKDILSRTMKLHCTKIIK